MFTYSNDCVVINVINVLLKLVSDNYGFYYYILDHFT